MSDERLMRLLLLSAFGSFGMAAVSGLLGPKPLGPELWYAVHFGRDVDPDGVDGFLRWLAADRRRFVVALEVVGRGGSVHYRIGLPARYASEITTNLASFVGGVSTELIAAHRVAAPNAAWKIVASSARRPLRSDAAEHVSRALLGALTSTGPNETLTLQWLLGPRRQAENLTKDQTRPAESWGELLKAAALGQPVMDHDERKLVNAKTSEPGFRTLGRIAVRASSTQAGQALALRLLGALRMAESAGVRLSLETTPVAPVLGARVPRSWPLPLNVSELTSLLGWPLGGAPLPGMNRDGARLLRPPASVTGNERVIGASGFPGDQRRVVLPVVDALQHLHVLGPTGVGKSTLLLGLITQDIAAGRGVVVIDPKGDLVCDVLARVPSARHRDVVVLDPTDEARPVGMNVLSTSQTGGRSPELVADQVLAVFHGLYKDSWGPRTQDILHASLLTLAGRPGVTLCDLPVLLNDARYRAEVTSALTDEIALRPFWHWFENISEAERLTATTPLMNKLRAFLLRPRMRAVLGQAEPRFDLSDVFTQQKIVLVSLAKGTLGPEAAALLGSLVVSQLWQAALGRVAINAARRSPVMVFIDEFQDYLHLPTDLADVLAQARGLGMGLTLAHQHLAQLTPPIRSAVLANARSRVCFQLAHDDARTMATMTNGLLEPADFTQLARFEAYATLVASGSVLAPASIRTAAPTPALQDASVVRALSRATYGTDRAEVEAALSSLINRTGETPAGLGRRRRP